MAGAQSGIQQGASNGFGLRGLLNGAISNFFNKKAEKRQFEYQKKLMEYQNYVNSKSIMSTKQGLVGAGLNPAMMMGQTSPAGVSGGDVSQSKADTGSGSSNNPLVSAQQASIEGDVKVKESAAEANKASAREHNANAEATEIENENARQRWQNKDTILSGEAFQMATSNKYFEDMTKEQLRALGASADVSKWEAKCKEIDSFTRGRFNEATIDNIVSQTGLNQQQAATLVTTAKLNGVLMSYYGEETRAKRYMNDMNDYFNSFGWDANPLARREFQSLQKLITDTENAVKNGGYTTALTTAQEFANEYAPADKAFQWGNMILNSLMTGLMLYGTYKGLRGPGAASPGTVITRQVNPNQPPLTGVGSQRVNPISTNRKVQTGYTSDGRATYETVFSPKFNKAAMQARAHGWEYDENSHVWFKYINGHRVTASDNGIMMSYGKYN